MYIFKKYNEKKEAWKLAFSCTNEKRYKCMNNNCTCQLKIISSGQGNNFDDTELEDINSKLLQSILNIEVKIKVYDYGVHHHFKEGIDGLKEIVEFTSVINPYIKLFIVKVEKYFDKPTKILTYLRDLKIKEYFIPQLKQLQNFCYTQRNLYHEKHFEEITDQFNSFNMNMIIIIMM
jgi:hypothetical protein